MRWLLAEWPATNPEPVQFSLSNLPADTPLATLVRTAKLRWRIEHDYREMKQAVGLAHFEGRTWRGWHHHWHSSRPPTSPAPAATPAPMQRAIEHLGADADATAAFVGDLTTALVETGLPRTAARVMACLFASETGSRTAIEMAQHLQVSAPTISHAVRLLERQDLIRRGRDDRSRRHWYFLDDKAGLRTVAASVAANQRFAATALRGAGLFGAETAAGSRLALAGRFLERLGNDLIRSAEKHWRDMVGDRGDEYTLTSHAE